MADVSSLVGNAGSPASRPSVTCRETGRRLAARYIDDDVRAAFENHLKDEARREVMDWCRHVQPHEAKVLRQELVAELSAGKYGWDDYYCRNALNGSEGTMVLASIVLGCTLDEVRGLYRRQADEMNLLMEQVWAESQPAPPEGGEGNPGAAPTPSPSSEPQPPTG